MGLRWRQSAAWISDQARGRNFLSKYLNVNYEATGLVEFLAHLLNQPAINGLFQQPGLRESKNVTDVFGKVWLTALSTR